MVASPFASPRRALALTCILPAVSAHIALWHPSMYGWDPNDPNQSEPVTPLYNLTFDEWWFHGYIKQPPAAGQILNLPSGGTYHGEVACNKALTSFGQNPAQQTGLYACDGDGPDGGIGPLHTSDAWMSPDPLDVMGCGIAIVYESDVSKIKPEDFTVITVNYTCPWWKHVDFQIPADLPPCPEGGCHCMWGWVHAADAGSEQMYFNGYRCNVTGAMGTVALPHAKVARKCPVEKSNCTIGAKQPHYWLQQEQNNNFQGYYDPPFYNDQYGFTNGAQTDLFAAITSLTGSQCARRKRALDQLEASPDERARHEKRAAARRERISKAKRSSLASPAVEAPRSTVEAVLSVVERWEVGIGLRRGAREGSAEVLGLGVARRKSVTSRFVARAELVGKIG